MTVEMTPHVFSNVQQTLYNTLIPDQAVPITEHVVDFDIQRGRSYELDRIEAGVLALTVDNTDGTFDPFNTSSRLYEHIVPYRQIGVGIGYLYEVWEDYSTVFIPLRSWLDATDSSGIAPAGSAGNWIYTTYQEPDAANVPWRHVPFIYAANYYSYLEAWEASGSPTSVSGASIKGPTGLGYMSFDGTDDYLAIDHNYAFGLPSVSVASIAYTGGDADGNSVAPYEKTVDVWFQSDELPGYRALVLDSSPVSYWRLGENAVTGAAVDEMGLQNGTYVGSPATGASLLSGSSDLSHDFNGSSQYVTAADQAAYSVGNTGELTVECWINRNDQQDDNFVAKSNGASGSEWTLGTLFGRPLAVLINTTGGIYLGALGPSSIPTGTNPHLAMTYNGTTLRVYVNGVEAASGSTATGTLQDSGSQPVTMAANAVPGAYYNGRLDEVAIYGTELSAATLLAHYNEGASGTSDGAGSYTQTLLAKYNGSYDATPSTEEEWDLSFNGAGDLSARLYNTTGGAYMEATATGAISASTGHYAAWTYDGTTLSLYLDGSAVASTTGTTGTLNDSSYATVHVATLDGSSQFFAGHMCDISIGMFALSAERIAERNALGRETIEEQSLFMGYVEQWPQDFLSDQKSLLKMTAVDPLAFLAKKTLGTLSEVAHAYGSGFGQKVPTMVLYPLDEEAGDICNFNSDHEALDHYPIKKNLGTNGSYVEIPAFPGTYVGNVTANSTDSIAGLSGGNAIEFQGGSDGIVFDERFINTDEVLDWSIEWWMSTTQSPTAAGYSQIMLQDSQLFGVVPSLYTIDYIDIRLLSNGKIQWFTEYMPYALQTTASYNDGTARHFALVSDYGGYPALYVNGAAAPTASATAPFVAPKTNKFYVARDNNDAVTTTSFVGTLDEIAFVMEASTSTAVVSGLATRYDIAANGFNNWDIGDIVELVLDYGSYWATTNANRAILRDISTGQVLNGAVELSNTAALEVLNNLARTEGGTFYADRYGRYTFRSRADFATQTRLNTVQATFGDGSGELPYSNVDFSYDDINIYNHITVNGNGGIQYVASDTDSTSIYGLRKLALTIYTDDQNDLKSVGEFFLKIYKDPQLSVRSVAIEPVDSEALWNACVCREIGDKIKVKRTTPWGTNINQDCTLLGVHHSYDARSRQWVTELYLQDAAVDSYFILDDATYGRLDYNKLTF